MGKSGNKSWVITKPAIGRYKADVLRLENLPPAPLKNGEVRIRTLYMSLDPSNLMWLKLQPGWMEDVKVGDIMKGPSLGVVTESTSPDFAVNDIVTGPLEWREYSNIKSEFLTKIINHTNRPLSTNLTIFSHVGRAAFIGTRYILDIKKGDTVLVSGAYGATGALACQIAKAMGCKVIGIAGGINKCDWLVDEMGIDYAIDYKSQNIVKELQKICPEGPNAFFDNVGGEMLDEILPVLAINARVVICGQISQYDHKTPSEAYRYKNLFQLLMRRMRIEGFVVPDFIDKYQEIDAELGQLYDNSQITNRPHILEGIEWAADGLEMLLEGTNRGKLMVEVATI